MMEITEKRESFKVMRGLLVCLVLGLLVAGCGKDYTENERLNYLDTSDRMVTPHDMVMDIKLPSLANPNARKAVQDIQDKNTEVLEVYKSKYQGTAVDKDMGLLEDFTALADEQRSFLNSAAVNGDDEARMMPAVQAYGDKLTAVKKKLADLRSQ